MKKYQRTIAAGLVLIVSGLGMYGCNDSGYKVIGDNNNVLAEHSAKRGDAVAFLLKTSVYVGEVRSMQALPVGADLSAQTDKMVALRSEADQLGNVLSPYSHCRSAGYKTSEYWSVVAGEVRTETPESVLAMYVEEAQQCQVQIDNAPAAVTYIEMEVDKKPPVEGCLKVVSLGSDEKVQEWSCPSRLISKS